MHGDNLNHDNANAAARLESELLVLRNAAVTLSLALKDILFELDLEQRKKSDVQTISVLEKFRHPTL